MTKPGPLRRVSLPASLVLVLAALLGLAPAALAHGAPEARELDVRVLLDDDGGLAYGGCIETCNPAAPPEGLDLLALDIREAWLGDAPALVLRIVFQYEAVHDGRGFVVAFEANGTAHQVAIDSADGTLYTSKDADFLAGPFDVGDGHPKALDVWLATSPLNATAGDALTQVTVQSTHHGEPDDVMPGTWFSQGVEVPHLPHDPADPVEALQEAGPGSYTLKGPAPLLALSTPSTLVDLAATGNVTLTLRNALAGLPQFANVTLDAPSGLQAALEGADAQGVLALNLDAAATRDVRLTILPGAVGGNLTILAVSDLGARATTTLQVVPLPPTNTSAEPTSTATGTSPAKDTPFPGGLLPVVAALALVALRRRNTSADEAQGEW